MSFSQPAYGNVHELKGEFFVLRVLVFCVSVYLFMSVASIFRLFGVPGIPQFLLLGYRILDILVIGVFFLTCGARVKVRWIDFPLLLMITYPILIGIGRGNINITYFNDISVFVLFLLKVLVIRTLVLRFMAKTDFDEVFRRYAAKIIRRSMLAAILLLAIASMALMAGLRFYYQAPVDLTFAAALAISQRYVPTFLMILALATMGGKRAIMLGILAVGSLGSLTRKHFVRILVGQLILIAVALGAVFLGGENSVFGDAAFARRLTATWYQIETAANDARNWEVFLMNLDPRRFAEYVSLAPHLEGWAFWLGNGYGFRYVLDHGFLESLGRTSLEGSVSNAHFTPLAIAAKFGVIGVGLWVLQIAGVLFSLRNSSSYFQTACFLGFISMLVQSVFAFGFFISFFTPFFIAGSTLVRSRRSRRVSMMRQNTHFAEVS